MAKMCLIVTPEIRKLTENITKSYPNASQRAGLTADMVAEWVGAYNEANNQKADFVPWFVELVDYIEKKRNMDGKSFLAIPESIVYTPVGKKQQTYTVIGTKIFNKDGKEVFSTDSKDRRRIFANLAVQNKRGVVVEHQGKKYVVNQKDQIISVATGDEMKWGEESGDRKAVLAAAKEQFKAMNQSNDSSQSSVSIDRGKAFEDLKDGLSKVISTGRSGYMSVTASPNDYNGAPVITVSVYNSASDTDTESQYRLTPDGKLESRNRWTSEEWKDDWKEGNSSYAPINEFFESLKKAASATTTLKAATETPKVEVFHGFWTREQVAQQQDKIFLFGDNTNDRVSTHYIPSSTQAVIRGLPNAVGIDTKKNRGTSVQSYFTDEDFDQFKAQVDAALNWAKNDGRTIVIPADGIGTGKAMLKEKAPKCFEYLQSELQKLQNPTINSENNRLNNKEINYGNEFRRVQETVRGSSSSTYRGSGGSQENIDADSRQRLAKLLRRELESQSSFSNGTVQPISSVDKQGVTHSFNLHTNVDPQIFHDVFEVARHYTANGELVDLHDDYTGCKCYLNEDGTCGFAIEPDGNLVSVFNLGINKGFLTAMAPYAIAQGATHLDAYNSALQPLRDIYEKVFGAKVASSMDYNMEYDHDDIAKNHGNPDVVFMVMGKSAEKDIEERHFNGDQYDEAVDWQRANIDVEAPAGLAQSGTAFTTTPPSSATPSDATPTSTPTDATYGMSDAMEAFYQKAAAEKAAMNGGMQSASLAQPNKPKSERPKSAAYESALKPNDSRMAQFKRTFSPQQIKDRGAMIADKFSAIIDNALWDEMDACLDVIESDTASEEEKTQARQRMNSLRDPLNGRQLVAKEKGIAVIMQEIRQEIETDMGYATDELKPLYQNTLDYFTELFDTQATLDIEEREGIRIVGLKVAEQTASEEDNDSQDDGDDETGHTASGSDGWSFQVRYEDPFNSLSKKVRSIMYDVERPNSEKDDLGNTRKYPMGQIYASLLSYLAKNMHSADDFLQIDKSFEGQDNWGNDITEDTYPNGYPTFPVLEQMMDIYPWVGHIIQRLTDDYMNPEWNSNLRYPSTGGTMASQFYTNFRKAYIPYAKIQLGDGKFGVTPLNYEMEERAQYDKLEANYNNRMILSEHSIYNADGKVNKENAKWLKSRIQHLVSQLRTSDFKNFPELMEYHSQHPEEETLDEKDIEAYNNFIAAAREVMNSFGIDATTDGVIAYLMMNSNNGLEGILADLEWVSDNIIKIEDNKVDSFNYILDTRDRYGTNLWSHFFDGRGMITDASYMQSFYDSASHKTKYSYSADNYLMKMFRGACMGTLAERRQFIDEHFGKYEWFKNQKTGEWRNKWLEYWYNEPAEQTEIPYKNIDNITDYSGDEVVIRQYTKWTRDDIWQVQNRSFGKDNNSPFAFFLAPIFSDSPMSMTVKGPKMDMQQLLYGFDDAAGHHQGALVAMVNQELWRIGYVQRRAEEIKNGNVEAISNFDGKRGQQFCFLPELNSYVFEDTGESFLERMMRLKRENAILSEIEASQIQAIQAVINAKMGQYMVENQKHYSAADPISPEVYYNMVYANAAIIQMTTVDLAFYKNDTDFQKRYKEVYAGGIQLNTNSKYGKKTENIILLSDDIITSPSYDKIAAIVDGSDTLSQEDKDFIKSTFTEINVADAQAIRAMHSFRSVLDMMGRWDDRMEEALQHFRDNQWNREDFDVIFQTIKPFAYSVIDRRDGFGGSIPVPQQNKNSEICALMMYDLITNGLNDSPVYKALSRFMEENVDANGEHLIDMAQFESAGKVGNQGVVNISFNPNKVVAIIEHGVVIGGEEFEFDPAYKDGKFLENTVENAEENYKAIKEDLDKELREGKTTQDEYNKIMAFLRPTEDEIIDMLSQAVLVTNPDGSKGTNPEVVHTIPFDNYYQQQPTPEHHIDAEATFGSQARNIIVADLPDNFEITLDGKGKNKKTFKGKDAIIDFYYELLNENLIEDFFGKGKKQGLKGIFSSKESLRDAVTDIVRGNPKYGRDFAEALQVDDNGNFVLSPNSPTMFNLMQELVTSFFKNRITKQTINGAALIQAAGIGLDSNLRMVFDEDGKLQGAECLMPLTTKKFFEPLLEEKTINGEKVKVLSPEKLKKAGLDKAIGYRIPTENKSSMMPLIIKGFTPLQNGSSIVLPAEITDIAGSDFDVDKMFIMLLSFYIQTHDMRKARETWIKQQQIIKEIKDIFYNSDLLDEISEADPEPFREWFEEHKDEFELATPIIRKIEYDFSKSPKENGRKARNNMLIQMMYGILTSKEGSESLFNPQGFADVKRAAKITRILTDPNLHDALVRNTEGAVAPGVMPSAETILSEFLNLVQERYPDKYDTFKQAVTKMTTEQIQEAYLQAITAGNKGNAIKLLMESSTNDLEKFIEQNSAPESPVFPQTFAHSHAKNMAGANQIGIYAIQGSMAAKYQRADVRMREEQQFTVNGRTISNVDVSDGGRRLKNVGQMIGASADNGKDPNLSDMGSTDKTAPMIGFMLRAGLSHLEAALIINQEHMWMSRYSSKNYKYWKSVLGKNPLATSVDNVNTEMLIKGLISPFELTAEEDKQIAALCYRILMQHEAQEYLTQISRADSPNGAMQNSYAKARIQQYKVDLFQAKMGQRDFPFVRIKEAISNKAVNTAASEDEVREQLRNQKMGFLHGMYALGINSFNDLVAPYFFGARKHFDDAIVKPILYNLNERLSDAKKEAIVNNIYTSYITFMLSGASLFGSEEGATMKQKRDYYLESFPDDYMKVIQENGDIRELLSSVLQVKNFGSRKRVILQDVGSLSKGQKQDVQRRFESLAYSDNPVARQLAKDLFVYSYFDNGLQFTHDSFSHLFTTEFLTNFPVYNETLLGLDEELTPDEETNFIHQFLLTYPDAAYKVDNIIANSQSATVFDDHITIDLNDKQMRQRMINEVMSPNPQFEGINVYPYISYNGEVYVLDQELFDQYPGTPLYHKLAQYATYPRLPLFSREMNVSELAQEFPVSDRAAEEEIPDVGSVAAPEAPIAHNEGSEDPTVDNSMNAAFDAMDDFDVEFDPSDIDSAPASQSDTYSSEGNAELQKPMC